jgi:hypothetical protein
MKKIIGIVLIVLFLVAVGIGLSLTLYSGGVSLLWSIVTPFLCYIGAALMIGFSELVTWLLK